MNAIPGRPRGPVRLALGQALDAPDTSRGLAGRASVAVAHARRTIDNMRRSGQITIVERVHVDGVKQAVPVYAITQNLPNQPMSPGAQLHLYFLAGASTAVEA